MVNVKRYRCKTFPTSLLALCMGDNFFTSSLEQGGGRGILNTGGDE